MSQLTISEALRCQHISRWTIVATARPQSLAEHTFNVVMLADHWCKQLGLRSDTLIKAALEHDLDEIHTGDIPTPSKRRMRERGVDPRILEDERPFVALLDPGEHMVLKALDVLESVHFLTNFAVGLRAHSVRAKLSTTFDELVDDIDNISQPGAEVLREMKRELVKMDAMGI